MEQSSFETNPIYIYDTFKIIENIIQLLRFQPGNAFIPVEMYVETAICI